MRSSSKKIKILVLHNGPLHVVPEQPGQAEDRLAELEHLGALAAALGEHGFEVSVVDAEDDASRISHAVVVEQPDLIFNLVHQFRGDTLLNPNVASLLQLHGLPHTGSDPLCLSSCQDRIRTHLMLGDAGVPVPDYVVVRDINAIPDTAHLPGPLAVSHTFDDIYDEPALRVVVRSRAELEEKARELAGRAELPLLVERFLVGRRIQAVVLGNRALEVLPLTERLPGPDGQLGDARVAQLDPDSADLIRALAQRSFRVMDCRDCAQVDFALDDGGAPFVTDVRPAFDSFPGSPFIAGAHASALGFGGALAHLAEIAIERTGVGRVTAPAADQAASEPDSAPTPELASPASEPGGAGEPDEVRAGEPDDGALTAEGGDAETAEAAFGPDDAVDEGWAPSNGATPTNGTPLARPPRITAPPRRPASRGRPRTRLATEPGIPLAEAVPPGALPGASASAAAEASAAPTPARAKPAKAKPARAKPAKAKPAKAKPAKAKPAKAKPAKAKPAKAKPAKATSARKSAAKKKPAAKKTRK